MCFVNHYRDGTRATIITSIFTQMEALQRLVLITNAAESHSRLDSEFINSSIEIIIIYPPYGNLQLSHHHDTHEWYLPPS